MENDKYNILVFSQNVKLDSLKKVSKELNNFPCIILTTHKLFQNEKEYILSIIDNPCFTMFADFLTDVEAEFCDDEAYKKESKNVSIYIDFMKQLKNEKIINNIENKYNLCKKIIVSNDLGIFLKSWLKSGYKFIPCEYYYTWTLIPKKTFVQNMKNRLRKLPFVVKLWHIIKHKNTDTITEDVYSAKKDGKRYIFVGRPHRVLYRIDLDFQKDANERNRLVNRQYYKKGEGVYLTSIHEKNKCKVPDSDEIELHYIQDGYLPPNYSGRDLMFIPKHVSYYTWDKMGMGTFNYHNIPAQIMPFRKKLYMPAPVFPSEVKNVLYVASGSGDWTAQKNRSDDDLALEAIGEMARKFPNINFIFRCHPTWAHPSHVGVNSINRAIEYYDYLNLPNLKISSNIPHNEIGNFILSFERSSLEDDLKNADVVLGEHSVSMIDAAFDKIPFASINLTNRRNFFCGMTDLGFPMCDSLEKIASFIEAVPTKVFQENYLKAVSEYNRMTDIEE